MRAWPLMKEVRNCLALYNRNNHRRCLKTVALLRAWPVKEVRNCLAFYNRNNHRRCCHRELKTVALLRAWPVNPNRTRGMMAAAVAVAVTTHYTAMNAGSHAPETATQGS